MKKTHTSVFRDALGNSFRLKITDKMRLDWLARRRSGFRVTHSLCAKWFCVETDGRDSGGNTFRASIDAAIRASKKIDRDAKEKR